MSKYIELCPNCSQGYVTDFHMCQRCEGKYMSLTHAGEELIDFLELMGIEIPDPEGIRYN